MTKNTESAWDEEFQFEQSAYTKEPLNLAVKIFSDFCCNGCACISDGDHKKDPKQ